MTEITDPALELADLCDNLDLATNKRGDIFLAETFQVEPWSPEFFQIINTIVTRTAQISRMLEETAAHPAVLTGAKQHLSQIRGAFTATGLGSQWKAHGQPRISKEHSSPIRMLSPSLPARYRLPKLTDDEVAEVTSSVEELLVWLKDKQLAEKDFIRESLIEGLEAFLFRFERLAWSGWGYSIDSLRDVLLAYLTLERGLDTNVNPDAGAILKKTGTVLRKIFAYAGEAKDASETGEWLIDVCYKAIRGASGPSAGYIAGYLTT